MTKNHETGGLTGGPSLTLEQRAELFRSKEEILQLVDEKHMELEGLKKKLAEQEERLRKMGKTEISEGIKKAVEGNVAWPDIIDEIYREVMKIIDDILIKADKLLVEEIKKREGQHKVIEGQKEEIQKLRDQHEVLTQELARYSILDDNVPVIHWSDANYRYDHWVPKEALEKAELKLKKVETALLCIKPRGSCRTCSEKECYYKDIPTLEQSERGIEAYPELECDSKEECYASAMQCPECTRNKLVSSPYKEDHFRTITDVKDSKHCIFIMNGTMCGLGPNPVPCRLTLDPPVDCKAYQHDGG